ncbi:hypothetical protein B0H11DRAFT_1902329 [Mycena galericulata]|nr:hypothetical protein B0H11DRAFT_1907409 [Mycena galericulata]KAJ7508015.1 hypothetical protein B0H11DRAFT_1902329 [Mycena galericulata]
MAFIHWVPKLHVGATPIPPIPCADLPRLSRDTILSHSSSIDPRRVSPFPKLLFMSDLYTSLYTSLRERKRCPPECDDDTTTPKKLRIVSVGFLIVHDHRSLTYVADSELQATALHRPAKLQTHAPPSCHPTCRDFAPFIRDYKMLSLNALTTCAVSPSSDTGIVRNVLNNLSLSAYSRLSTQFEVDDLRRLCWIWEWDGITPPSVASSSSQDDNPFLEEKPAPKDWTRGAMGIVLSPATHRSRVDGKRVPVYGIGINVDMPQSKGEGSSKKSRPA